MNVHFSSKTDEWETPQDLFNKLNEEFNFTIDVCAVPENAKCMKFYNANVCDALLEEWDDVCWMNPPYGREIGKWIKKAYESMEENNATVVCLIPARTDTAWWHDYVMKGEVRFLRGRLKFSNAKFNAPFPCAIVIFREPK